MKKCLILICLCLVGFIGLVRADDVDQRVKTLEDRLNLLEKSQGPKGMSAYWDRGLKIDSLDQRFQMSIGGRMYWDTAFVSADDSLKSQFSSGKANFLMPDGTEFRTIRLETEGLIYRKVEFSLSVDLVAEEDKETENVESVNKIKDAYMGLVDLPWVGNLRVGYIKEPFSLEELTSSKYGSFMERSLANAFAPGRHSGILFQNNIFDKRATWAAGAFANTDDYGFKQNSYGGEYNGTGRLTVLPVYKEDGKKLIHMGLDYSYRKPNKNNDRDNVVSYDTRPEADLVGKLDGTGDIMTTGRVQLIGTELAAIYGPLSFQGEFTEALLDVALATAPSHFFGYSLQASYFLTGESKNYKRSSAKFGATDPSKNFGDDDGGKGAWEVAVRYSKIDLNDNDGVNRELKASSRRGGVLSDVTVGLNWYLNPLTRVMMNYVYSDLQNIGIARILQTRVQVSF